LMPYLNSAHSSIIMSCGHHSGAVIVSDIELFRRLLPNYPLTFESGNVEALTNVLKKTAGMSAHEIKKIELSVEQSIKSAGKSLVEDLKVAYGS
jgi:hypothetical protein